MNTKRKREAQDESRFVGWTQTAREAHLRKLDRQINRQVQIRAALDRVIRKHRLAA
jgi:hypothetical protein